MSTKNKAPELVTYTGFARLLIVGRPKTDDAPGIPNLIHSARATKEIWNDADNKIIKEPNPNPFALWYLYLISNKVDEIEVLISKEEARIEALYRGELSDNMQDFSEKTVNAMPISYLTPYSWIFARIIKAYDSIVLRLHRFNHLGLINDSDLYKRRTAIHKKIITLFITTLRYKSFDVTFDDATNNTENYQKACAQLGVVPKGIISGKLKANFIPMTYKLKLENAIK